MIILRNVTLPLNTAHKYWYPLEHCRFIYNIWLHLNYLQTILSVWEILQYILKHKYIYVCSCNRYRNDYLRDRGWNEGITIMRLMEQYANVYHRYIVRLLLHIFRYSVWVARCLWASKSRIKLQQSLSYAQLTQDQIRYDSQINSSEVCLLTHKATQIVRSTQVESNPYVKS